MPQLTTAQIQDQTAILYQAKQQLAELDNALNTQGAAIMEKARADVSALRATLSDQRASLLAIIATAEKKLNEGDPDAPTPADVKGFEGALKAIYANDLVALNVLVAKYPLFLWSLRDENWGVVSQMLLAAVENGDVSADRWGQIQAAAAIHNLPLGSIS